MVSTHSCDNRSRSRRSFSGSYILFSASVGSRIVEDRIKCRPSECDRKGLYRVATNDASVWMQHDVVVSVVQRDNVEEMRNVHKFRVRVGVWYPGM